MWGFVCAELLKCRKMGADINNHFSFFKGLFTFGKPVKRCALVEEFVGGVCRDRQVPEKTFANKSRVLESYGHHKYYEDFYLFMDDVTEISNKSTVKMAFLMLSCYSALDIHKRTVPTWLKCSANVLIKHNDVVEIT